MAHVRNRARSGPHRRLLRLAPGIRLTGDTESSAATLLVSSAGKVPLNEHAVVILELCDGSRTRDRVVMDAILRSSGAMRAADVAEFLGAAQARGWLTDGE
ncbi:MAG TPA: PqqD family peptide modification chaperone [Steroidobacteraceae bacterium]|nr:PqqD family peptide modification chaperone [Steroidobacteraceae bacterium]